MPLDFTKPLHAGTPHGDLCKFQGELPGGKRFRFAVELPSGYTVMVDEEGLKDGSTRRSVFNPAPPPPPRADAPTAPKMDDTAILLLTESIDRLNANIERLIAATAPAGKHETAAAPAQLRAVEPPKPARAPEKLKRSDYLDSELLTDQLEQLAALHCIRAIHPGHSSVGVLFNGVIRSLGSFPQGVRARGGLDRGKGIVDLFIYCGEKDRHLVEAEIDRLNANLNLKGKRASNAW